MFIDSSGNSVVRLATNLAKGLLATPTLLRYSLQQQTGQPPVEVISIDLRRFLFGRYFYNFCKFLEIEGYGVNLAPRLAMLHTLEKSEYANWLLHDGVVRLAHGDGNGVLLGDGRRATKRIVPWDLVPIGTKSSSSYVVPMAQHPVMYSKGYYNQPVTSARNGRTMLFVGNYGSSEYEGGDLTKNFGILNRATILTLLRKIPGCIEVEAADQIGVASGARIRIADTRISPIPAEDFREVIGTATFFVGAPGVFMPLCHNLIEAMSVGTIPVLQRGYAEMMSPKLKHMENAIIFEGAEDFGDKIDLCFSLNTRDVAQIRMGVMEYHDSHLTPAAVVGNVLREDVTSLRMLAGKTSVRLRRQKLREQVTASSNVDQALAA